MERPESYMRDRIEHIDIAKGIGIIFVAFTHSKLTTYFPLVDNLQEQFVMPLFFLISGTFFSNRIDFRTFALRKSDALIKPYLVTCFVLAFLDYLLSADKLMLKVASIPYGTPFVGSAGQLWFLTNLWVVFIFCYFLTTFFKLDTVFRKVTCLLLMIPLGCLSMQYFWLLDISVGGRVIKLPGLPFGMDLLPLTAFFFLSGYFMKEHIHAFKRNVFVLLLALIGFLWLAIHTESRLNLYHRIYENMLCTTIAALLGCYILLHLSVYLSKLVWIGNALGYIGSASLFILMFHCIIGNSTLGRLIELNDGSMTMLHMAAIATFISIVGPLILKLFIEKLFLLRMLYLPLKSGKSDHKKSLRIASAD